MVDEGRSLQKRNLVPGDCHRASVVWAADRKQSRRELFLSTHDYRYGIFVQGMAKGESLKVTAERSGHLCSSLCLLKSKLAANCQEFAFYRAAPERPETDCHQFVVARTGFEPVYQP